MRSMFSVYDKKASVYCTPFVSHSEATAVRDFRQAVNDPASSVSSYASDFDLYELGTWHEDSGEIDQHQMPKFVVNGGSLKGDL